MKYTFYIEYLNGNQYQQEKLTRRQAVIRYNKFTKSGLSWEAKRWGYRLENDA